MVFADPTYKNLEEKLEKVSQVVEVLTRDQARMSNQLVAAAPKEGSFRWFLVHGEGVLAGFIVLVGALFLLGEAYARGFFGEIGLPRYMVVLSDFDVQLSGLRAFIFTWLIPVMIFLLFFSLIVWIGILLIGVRRLRRMRSAKDFNIPLSPKLWRPVLLSAIWLAALPTVYWYGEVEAKEYRRSPQLVDLATAIPMPLHSPLQTEDKNGIRIYRDLALVTHCGGQYFVLARTSATNDPSRVHAIPDSIIVWVKFHEPGKKAHPYDIWVPTVSVDEFMTP